MPNRASRRAAAQQNKTHGDGRAYQTDRLVNGHRGIRAGSQTPGRGNQHLDDHQRNTAYERRRLGRR